MQSQLIDVALGLALTFVVLSVLVSAVQEYIAGLLSSRATQLEKGIKCLLFGQTDPKSEEERKFINELFRHPLLFNLSQGERLASYLPPGNFSKALIEVAGTRFREGGRTAEGVRDLASAVNSDSWRKLLAPLEAEAKGDIERLRREIEIQYGQMMDRVSGWYKRRAQWFMLLYGFLLAATLNVDAIELTTRLWRDPVIRASMVASATELSKSASAETGQIKKILDESKELQNLPIGWPTKWSNSEKPACSQPRSILFSLFGWLITALAASMGAPFWFDIIGKLVRLRSSGLAPERPPEPKSEPPGSPSSGKGSAAASAPSMPPQSQEELGNRNAIISMVAERHKDDESYRPVSKEERW